MEFKEYLGEIPGNAQGLPQLPPSALPPLAWVNTKQVKA